MEYLLNQPLSYNKLIRGRALPFKSEYGLSGGCCDMFGKFVENTALHEKYYDGSYSYDESEVIVKRKKAVFLGTWHGIYGHAITDNLKKIWFLETEEYDKLREEKPDLIFNYIGDNISNCVYDIFKVLGFDVKTDFTRICSIVQYDEIFIPDDSIQLKTTGRYYAYEYKRIINEICENCRTTSNDFNKIYLTRSGINDGKDFGEKAIESVFEDKGYVVVSPEKFSFRQQVDIMQSCKMMVTTEGSISHNSLFCKEGIEIILLKKADFNNTYQCMINDMKQHKVTSLVSTKIR